MCRNQGHPQSKIFHHWSTPLNVISTNFGNKTPWDPIYDFLLLCIAQSEEDLWRLHVKSQEA
jgi:hypothetical protein